MRRRLLAAAGGQRPGWRRAPARRGQQCALHHPAPQAQKEFPPDFQNCKDKFKVETLALDAGEVGRWGLGSASCRCRRGGAGHARP